MSGATEFGTLHNPQSNEPGNSLLPVLPETSVRDNSLSRVIQAISQQFPDIAVEFRRYNSDLDSYQGDPAGNTDQKDNADQAGDTEQEVDGLEVIVASKYTNFLEIDNSKGTSLQELAAHLPANSKLLIIGTLRLVDTILQSKGFRITLRGGAINIHGQGSIDIQNNGDTTTNTKDKECIVKECDIVGPVCSATGLSRLKDCRITTDTVNARGRATFQGCTITTEKLNGYNSSVFDKCRICSPTTRVFEIFLQSDLVDCSFQGSGTPNFVLTRTAKLIKPTFRNHGGGFTLRFADVLTGVVVDIPRAEDENYARVTLGSSDKLIPADQIPQLTLSPSGQMSKSTLEQLRNLRDRGHSITIEVIDSSGNHKRSILPSLP